MGIPAFACTPDQFPDLMRRYPEAGSQHVGAKNDIVTHELNSDSEDL